MHKNEIYSFSCNNDEIKAKIEDLKRVAIVSNRSFSQVVCAALEPYWDEQTKIYSNVFKRGE